MPVLISDPSTSTVHSAQKAVKTAAAPEPPFRFRFASPPPPLGPVHFKISIFFMGGFWGLGVPFYE
jgi:hypothetical protein